jgi:hypothetical protein
MGANSWDYLTGLWKRGIITKQQARDQLKPFNYYDAIRPLLEARMKFNIGQHVRLKDTDYAGTVSGTDSLAGNWWVTVQMPNDHKITVTDPDMLEPVIEPQLGDVYTDKHGNEWIAVINRVRTGDNLTLICVDIVAPHFFTHVGYSEHTVADWEKQYEPKLKRRRP